MNIYIYVLCESRFVFNWSSTSVYFREGEGIVHKGVLFRAIRAPFVISNKIMGGICAVKLWNAPFVSFSVYCSSVLSV